MQGWLFSGAHQALELIERSDPKAGPGQVVVDVRAAGLCHSDVGFLDGTLTAQLRNLPLILGHEVAGTIAASTVGFEDIPKSLERLKRGGVVGRLVATP
jgi:propanol-preferring alcohol dehydrogenase